MLAKKGFWILVLLFMVWSIPGWAQHPRDVRDRDFRDFKEKERIRERIQTIKMWKLTEALKLDRETSARFFAVHRQYEESKRRARQDLQDEIQRLRNLMSQMNPPEREVKEQLNRMKSKKKELEELNQRQVEEEMNLLRPEQQARYLLFMIDFRREMDEIVREIREGRGHGPSPEPRYDRVR